MRDRSNKAIDPHAAAVVVTLAASTFFASNNKELNARPLEKTAKDVGELQLPIDIINQDLLAPLPKVPIINIEDLEKLVQDSRIVKEIPREDPNVEKEDNNKPGQLKKDTQLNHDKIDIDWAEVSTVGIFTLTVTAALLTIGKRFLFEIRDYYKDFNDWLNGRSLVSGSVDNFTFKVEGEHLFMELTSLGKFHVNQILEHKQAARQFKRAAQLCTAEESFVSLNYAKAARNLIRDINSFFSGVSLNNDFYRTRFDRELREAYSGLYREQTKRHMAGYEDGRDLHILIPMVERWSENVGKGPILRNTKSLTRAELSFVSISLEEFINYFGSTETIDKLIKDNPRYERRIRILGKAHTSYVEHKNRSEQKGISEVELPKSHPDYQVRQLNSSSLFPIVKVYEKVPKNMRESNGSLAV